MPGIGKFAVGLKGFPTPNNPEDADAYLLFYFPDKQWSQYVLGALSVLGVGYNWYKSGELDVDEAAEAFRTIVQDAPYNLKTCSNPDGGKIIRVAPNGHVQQLSDANTWEDPTGDYAIPPVPTREGSEPDILCLAAKNAANVLQQLYENVSDSFADNLSQAAAGVALISAISLIVGAEFAPITFSIVSAGAAIFGVFYAIMEFATADLWDAAFTDTMACILLGCASNDEGVVTFDWECFNNALAAQTSIFDLTFEQLRLFGQIQYLLLMVGGVDALNLAGATTAITDDDCSNCDCQGTSVVFGAGDQGFTLHAWDMFAGVGQYITNVFGTGWYLDTSGGHNQLGIVGAVDAVCGNGVNVNVTLTGGAPDAPQMKVRVTTSTQVKNATFTPISGVNDIVWDEGGELTEDSATVEIGYYGSSGYGAMVGSFQVGTI